MGLPADAGAHGPPPGTADVLYSSSMDGASISYDLDRVLVLSLERFLRGRRGVWLVLRVSHMPEVKGKRNVRQHSTPSHSPALLPSRLRREWEHHEHERGLPWLRVDFTLWSSGTAWEYWLHGIVEMAFVADRWSVTGRCLSREERDLWLGMIYPKLMHITDRWWSVERLPTS